MSRIDLIERNRAKKLLQIEEARKDYEANPTNREKFRNYVNTLHSAGEYLVVKELLVLKLKDLPDDPIINFEMGLIQMKLNERIQAMHSFKKVLSISSAESDLYRSAEFELWNLDPAFVPSWVL